MYSPYTQKLVSAIYFYAQILQYSTIWFLHRDKTRSFHYCTCSTYSNVQHMREVETCRAQYQFLQFVSAQGCSSLEMLQGAALCMQGPDGVFHGALLMRWKHHCPQVPHPSHVPRASSVPIGSPAGPQTTPSQASLQQLWVETMQAQY